MGDGDVASLDERVEVDLARLAILGDEIEGSPFAVPWVGRIEVYAGLGTSDLRA